jgi:hypothetical protein
MADMLNTASTGPLTEEAFLADRQRFWASVTKFVTYVAGGLVLLLIALWYFLV